MNNINDYITEPRFKQMIVELSKAKSDDEVGAIIRQHNEVVMTEEEKKLYSDNVIADMERYMTALDKDLDGLKASTIRSKIGELDKAISFAYIAKNYFGKSQSWLLQRLNGSKVNGKETRFNKTELLKLQEAIHDLGQKLSSLVLV